VSCALEMATISRKRGRVLVKLTICPLRAEVDERNTKLAVPHGSHPLWREKGVGHQGGIFRLAKGGRKGSVATSHYQRLLARQTKRSKRQACSHERLGQKRPTKKNREQGPPPLMRCREGESTSPGVRSRLKRGIKQGEKEKNIGDLEDRVSHSTWQPMKESERREKMS